MTGFSVSRSVAAAVYALAAVVLIFRAGEPGDSAWWPSGILFGLWIASPVVTALWLAKFVNGIARKLDLAMIAAIAGFGFYLQWRVMFIGPPDAQNALILLFVPLYQWMAVAVTFVLAWLVGLNLRES
ncbi:hypothetical protein [Erythrobacter sp. QSSC1-22B]|uniref:hypothetical protein n=1 Tax=Erythrobacter sp. QSSC1-22B TaxID=1860125 RepID=UPI0011A35F7C|nr:hypothetical protein [Erythrobacter sp. QSSC1-22B]